MKISDEVYLIIYKQLEKKKGKQNENASSYSIFFNALFNFCNLINNLQLTFLYHILVFVLITINALKILLEYILKPC